MSYRPTMSLPQLLAQATQREWVLAVLDGRFGTAAYLAPDLPTPQSKVRNSTAASGTRVSVAIKGEIGKTHRLRRSRTITTRARNLQRVKARRST